MSSSATIAEIKAFWTGYRAGLAGEAWWKDGVEYVGCEYVGCGYSTLEDAIAETRKLEKERLLREEE